MALTSNQFQLLIQQLEQLVRKSQLDFIDKLRAKLLNHPCFGGETEVEAIISKLRTEQENDYRTNEYAGESLNESVQNSNLNAAVAVLHDQPSSPVLPVSDTCPIHGPSPINPVNGRANSGSTSLQKDNVLLNAHEIAAVPAHEETGNKPNSIVNTMAPNETNHDEKNFSNESNDQNYLIVLPDPDYFADSYVPVQISYKNVRKISDALNDNQESNTTLIDTDYPNDSLSTNEVPRKFTGTISEESNVGDLKSNVIDPHDLVSSNGFPVKCVKHDKHIEIIVTWLYEDPTVFRGGGGIREI
ncbi:unnamed protein product [Schistosoma rodhaini]|uniref:Uncharacterized protein n=1 Tax=Schistosoma rodhaini TaxID=6188 RepID=A0AA85FZF6_9TREM|nr:unnamed protein product [Schistosoma rodhaini]